MCHFVRVFACAHVLVAAPFSSGVPKFPILPSLEAIKATCQAEGPSSSFEQEKSFSSPGKIRLLTRLQIWETGLGTSSPLGFEGQPELDLANTVNNPSLGSSLANGSLRTCDS